MQQQKELIEFNQKNSFLPVQVQPVMNDRQTMPKQQHYKIRLIGQIIDDQQLQTIINCVQPLMQYLRKNDGSRYTGDINKIVKGALCSKIFCSNNISGNNVFSIDQALAKEYKEKYNGLVEKKKGKNHTVDKDESVIMNKYLNNQEEGNLQSKEQFEFFAIKYESQIQKQINKITRIQKDIFDKETINKPIIQKRIKKQRRKKTHDQYQHTCNKLEEIIFHLELQQFQGLLKSPFQIFKKDDLSLEQYISKLGAQEVLSYIKCYNYFSPLIDLGLNVIKNQQTKAIQNNANQIEYQ